MTAAVPATLVVASIVRDGTPHRVALAGAVSPTGAPTGALALPPEATTPTEVRLTVETAGAVQREATITLAPGVVYDLAAALAGTVEDPEHPRPPVVSDDGDTYEIDATVSDDGDTYEIGG